MAHDLRQHPQRAEDPHHRRLPPQLQQVDVEQRSPRALPIGVGHRRHGIGDVVDRQEVVGELEVGPPRRAAYAAGDGDRRPVLVAARRGWALRQLNGRLYEALTARLQRRRAYDLYHSVLQVELPEGTFVIEQAPVHDWSGKDPAVVGEGAVGALHWHVLDFERYELRRVGAGTRSVTDRKTGFCLGDRYRARGRALPAQPADPRYTGRCGLGATGRLSLEEGISVGYGDDYRANLEGQSLRLTGLPGGPLTARPQRERSTTAQRDGLRHHSASLLLRLRWRAAAPSIHVLRRCADSERCYQRSLANGGRP
jgi:hypothetical protein